MSDRKEEVQAVMDLMGIPEEAAVVIVKMGRAGDGHKSADVAYAATFLLSMAYNQASNPDRFLKNVIYGIKKMAALNKELVSAAEDDEPTLN